uniref:Myb-like domain-containing protein n=1 Tax=Arundo donax TaxID=35708 RepID=A0A0A9CR03_ARUDO
MNKSEGENDIKSKKGKRKRQYDKAAPAGSQIVLGEDKKRKSSVTLEEGLDTSKMSEKGEGKKKRRKEGSNVGQERQNTLAGGDGKSDTKEQKKSKDKNGGGGRDKKKVSQRKDKGRRVSFTDDVEVFNIDGCDNEEGDGSGESRLVHGKRFTLEEDAKIMEAMVNYAEMKQLGEKGLEMIASCIKHPETRGYWAEIATSLPHRPVMAILYKQARILLHRMLNVNGLRRSMRQSGDL